MTDLPLSNVLLIFECYPDNTGFPPLRLCL